MTLSEGSGSIFNTTLDIHFGVTGSNAAPLPEIPKVIHRIKTCQGKNSIEHWGHMPRIEEEAVTVAPFHI